jgi:hypothetical protein
MTSLTIIPYDPFQANRSHVKGVFKPIGGHGRGLQTRPSILPVDSPQSQVVADGIGDPTMRKRDSSSQKYTDKSTPVIVNEYEKDSSAGECGVLD